MQHIDPKWTKIWCPDCIVSPLLVDEMSADERNDHDALDLMCGRCKLVIATLHADKKAE